MKAVFVFLLALLVLSPPGLVRSQDDHVKKIAPIRRRHGHDEQKRQADAEREAAERQFLAPSPAPIAPLTAAVSLGFAGMDFNVTGGFVPPDTHAATGPDHIVETVNTEIAIYDRDTG